jgi:hypothetical protein
MISLRLVQLIERHSDELVTELVTKLDTSSRTTDLHKVPAEELRRRIHEILRHLSEWLLIKTSHDVEQRYFEIASAVPPRGRAVRLLLGDCHDQATSLGIPAARGPDPRPSRNLWRDGIVAPAGPVFRSRFVFCD